MRYVVALLAGCLLPSLLPGRAWAQAKVWARDFVADGQILELDVPPQTTTVAILWQEADGVRWGMLRRVRPGRHAYEMRDQPGWRGRVPILLGYLDPSAVRVRAPTWADELDMFLEPEQMLPTTINFFLRDHTLLGWRWNSVLLLLVVAGAAASVATVERRRWVPAVAGSFVLAWAAMDLRTAYDHFVMLAEIERHYPNLPPLEDVRIFADQAAAVIDGDTWSNEPLPGVLNSYLRYRLAEHPYVSDGASPPSTFLVTTNPAPHEVVLAYGGFYLVRRSR